MERSSRRTLWHVGAAFDIGLALLAVAFFYSGFPWATSVFVLLGALCVQRGAQNLRASNRARGAAPAIVALIRCVAVVALVVGGVALVLILALVFGMSNTLPTTGILLLALLVLLNAGGAFFLLRAGGLGGSADGQSF